MTTVSIPSTRKGLSPRAQLIHDNLVAIISGLLRKNKKQAFQALSILNLK